ncbi:SMI1/KNR4 family protein [Streptomyces sp. NPDC004311]|uniref:SMI1/KNR4 family protein n=1 Tax=Streptomyces sp. NPDC004311 TaxID=3364698 RepID=UPI00367B53F7
MSENEHVDTLLSIMPPTCGADERVDWRAVEQGWGTTFPSDYVAFMATYGAGGVSDGFSIVRPEAPTEEFSQAMGGETANARGVWEPEPASYGPGTSRLPVIAWGVSVGADIACWLTEGSDPDQWPVAVWKRHGSTPWTVYDCGMTEFLRRVFLRELADCPFSDSALWGAASPRFIHWREEQRQWDLGIDPWTGEPDPYAGMYDR